MPLTTSEQFFETLGRARSVLVVCPARPSIDALVSGAALAEFLKQSGKHADVVSDGFTPSAMLKFLPEIKLIAPELGQLHQFIVRVSAGEAGIERVYSETEEGGSVAFYITPKSGVLSDRSVTTESSAFRYDMIIAVDAQNLEALGSVYSKNAALFSAAPIITIGYAPESEFFGQINVIELTCTSVAEVVHTLLTSHVGAEIKPGVAQLLLTGMISATQSFKTARVNARTLQTASSLIALGADREIIVHHLYRQRTVATLKLWGAALMQLQADAQQPLLWSMLSREDFARTGASESDLGDLINELIYTAPHAKVFALVYERPENPAQVCVIVDAQKPYFADALTSGFVATRVAGNRSLFCFDHLSLAEAQQKVLNVLRAKMRL